MPANSTHPQVYRYPCYPIYIDKKYDRHYHDRNCMSFVRSRAETVNGLRQQINKNTAFLDGSAIYGSDENESKKLRARSGGRLKTDRRGRLPKSDVKNCIVNNKRDYCMLAGDKRSNVYPPLGAMHTIFVRYHNYIAGELAIHLFDASNELLFQEARKIVIAVLQRITLKEFLPRLLKGSSVPDHLLHGNYTYNDACDATLFNVMPVVAFRFGHSMVPNYLSMDCQFRLPLTDTFLNPHLVLRNVDSVLKESATDHALSMDNYFSHGIQNEFPTSPNNPTHRDILSFNIQRGRDHGLPPYNQWRRLCHLPAYTRFSQFYYGADGFRKVYRHVDDVDPFPGFMTEKRAGVLGDTLICLLTRQFEKIRFCDRYWWENPHYGITSEILRKEIDKTLLSHVICLTSGVYDIQRHVFRAPNNRTNALLPCQRVLKSAMDVRLFAFLSERKGK